ncbi:hypothetical protein [Streptomyces sp. SID161]|uniref:hypothetical protein n=1 Tax=Streptomyces sp. SID161 TaxID=2690251 RepID=UPI00136F64E8|nr:hypothetical protein [Streptomyces sp. SID161]MYW43067.1 hypothetical protein [Streptomyces sp. SID161]
MTTNTTTHTRGHHNTERVIAAATSALPLTAGIIAPFLNTDAATATDLAYIASAGLATANAMDALPNTLYSNLPAGDIYRAHRLPLFISHLTTGIALGMGTLSGPDGTDALLGGILQIATAPVPGIVSLGWWAATLLVPYQLRRVLGLGRRRRASPTHPGKLLPPPNMPPIPATAADQIAYRWAQYISDPATGSHPQQILTITDLIPGRQWTGIIEAPAGKAVTVTAESVSSLEGVPTDWISINPGIHAGQRTITVNLAAPAELDTSTLSGAWKKWVARTGGLMDGTHLQSIQDDPNTGGQVAVVVAGENLDRLHHPDRLDLAGALRTTPLLVSYEPRQNPREAVIRLMTHNPLQQGTTFPGIHVLKVNENGYIHLGVGISGFPTRIQLWDPALGAQHVVVCGVTGSGKGGTLQLISLAHHVNQHAIIYADPKGSSNPSVEKMAAHSGGGLDAAMGSLRIWWHGLQFRIEESRRLGMKNFRSSRQRPWTPLVMDEASKLLGENSEYKKEATFIINAGATLGRSLGMPIVGANQLLQLKEWGGDSAIRDNLLYGGSLVLHRSDSSQKHLIDLPDNFAGCNPADIPAAWSGDRELIYDPSVPLNDPERTFGLSFAASPGAHAEMSRTWILEDATPYIDTDNIAYPADWSFWDDRHALAEQSVLPSDQQNDDDSPLLFTAGIELTKRPETAEDKILNVLRESVDPLGIDTLYMHKNDIGQLADLKGSTLNNALTELVQQNRIHRGTERGTYGLGPDPTTSETVG